MPVSRTPRPSLLFRIRLAVSAASSRLTTALTMSATTVYLAAGSIVGIEGVAALLAMFGLWPFAIVLTVALVGGLVAARARARSRRRTLDQG